MLALQSPPVPSRPHSARLQPCFWSCSRQSCFSTLRDGAPGAQGSRRGPDPPVCQPLSRGEAAARRAPREEQAGLPFFLTRRVTRLAVTSAFPALSLQAKSCVRYSSTWDHRGLPCQHLGPLAGAGHPKPAGAAVSRLAESQGGLPLSVALSQGRGVGSVPCRLRGAAAGQAEGPAWRAWGRRRAQPGLAAGQR